MARGSSIFVVATVLLFCGGCSSSPPPKAPDTDATTKPEEPSKNEPSDEPAPDASSSAAEAATPKAPKPTGDHHMNYDDCMVLADVYGNAWFRDAMEKETNKNAKLAETVEKNHRASADGAKQNWLNACSKIVGSAMPLKNLKCATKAKTVARFNDCWDGRVD
jgi:PBP1b-binding outer membrane lipoprotein LpoB